MDLDSNLLKEFAKMTNDSEVKNENKYLRGTIIKNSGGKYVQLDGSTTATPISELVDVQEGDRVLVTIENHKATIVGNFSFPPSARKEQEALNKATNAETTANGIAETANAAQIKAKEASDKADEAINQSSIASASASEAKEQASDAIAKANNAQENVQEAKDMAAQASADATKAKNQAAASQASSAEAQAEVTRLQGEVDSAQEDINKALEDLETQAGEIAGIKETYSTKVEVGNTKAELETTITTKVGELETTVSETYSTKTENVALEGKLQAQITQNAEGLASQASKTEKLESDTAKAQQDVADALSKANAAQTAASSAQTKADAAKSAADTATADANAAAQKAQLAQNAADAATAAANAADQAVQEAQGDLDEAKQNLATVTSRVDATEAEIAEAQGKVDAAQEAVIDALADAAEARVVANNATEAANKAQQDAETAQGIANTAKQKADNAQTAADNAQAAADKAQADVAALTKRVTTAETTISQNSEQINLNANKIVETGEKIDNLEVGGRNLLLRTQTQQEMLNGVRINRISSCTKTDETYLTCIIYKSNVAWADIGFDIAYLIRNKTIKTNDVLTYSIYAKTDDTVQRILQFYSQYTVDGTTYNLWNNTIAVQSKNGNKISNTYGWTQYYVTFTIPESFVTAILNAEANGLSNGANFRIECNTGCSTTDTFIYWAAPKLEKGNKPTDWTPAPEDIESNIDSVKTNLANNYYTKTETDANIKVQSDRITSTVSRVETVEKTANDAQTSINNLEVGAKNLLLNTRSFTGSNISGTSTLSDEVHKDLKVRTFDNSSATSGYSDIINFKDIYPEKLGETYTLSFYAKGSGENKLNTFFYGVSGYVPVVKSVQSNGKITEHTGGYDGSTKWTLTDTWTRYWVTWTLKDTGDISIEKRVLFRLHYGGVANICGVKLEKGNKATDWTPAPEDAESSITNAQTAIDNLEIGGRNYISHGRGNTLEGYFENFDSIVDDDYAQATISVTKVETKNTYNAINLNNGFLLKPRDYEIGKQIVYSYDIMITQWEIDEGANIYEWWMGQRYTNDPTGVVTDGAWRNINHHRLPRVGTDCNLNEWIHVSNVYTIPEPAAEGINTQNTIQLANSGATDSKITITLCIKNVKIEYGNRETDWTPAPEDLNEDIVNAQNTADNAQTIANGVQTSVVEAHSLIQQLSDMIANLVTDANGTSLMTQTSKGWTFNMSTINSNLNAIKDAMTTMKDDQNDTNDALTKLTNLINSVVAKTAYINIGTDDNGDPCIELGKIGNAFKVRITNTAIDFLEGSTKIAYANNNTFYAEKMIVKNELQIGIGPGFVWRTRANGNMGLVYISG